MADWSNYYAILNVSPHASLEEIKKAFRRLARQYHPDLNPHNPTAAAKFKEIYLAYEILSDPQKRSQYDQKISNTATSEQTSSINAQAYYVKGVQKSLAGHYQKAIEYYNQAIQLRPNFLEAYIQRCEAYFHTQSYRQVLDDCYQILKLNPQTWEAYYYQGRVRKKLGYLEAAIESYTQAISLNPKEANTIYHRGFAYQELKQKKPAIQDFKLAAHLYYQQGNKRRYRAAIHELKNLSFPLFNLGKGGEFMQLIVVTFISVFFNPSGEILPKFSQLSFEQQLFFGVIYGIISELNITVIIPQLSFLGITIFLILSFWFTSINFYKYRQFKGSTSVFIAGIFTLSSSLVIAVQSYLEIIPLFWGISFLIILGSSSFLLLYSSFTQLLNLSEQKSTYLTMLTLILLTVLYFARVL